MFPVTERSVPQVRRNGVRLCTRVSVGQRRNRSVMWSTRRNVPRSTPVLLTAPTLPAPSSSTRNATYNTRIFVRKERLEHFLVLWTDCNFVMSGVEEVCNTVTEKKCRVVEDNGSKCETEERTAGI